MGRWGQYVVHLTGLKPFWPASEVRGASLRKGCPSWMAMGKKPRPRRSSTRGFRTEIVELRARDDRSLDQVEKDLDLTETAVRQWVSRTGPRRSSRQCQP